MRFLIFIFAVLAASSLSAQVPKGTSDELIVAFWNLENLFDCKADSLSLPSSSDREFTPRGSKHWTPSRFNAKCLNVARTILYMGDVCGHLPDVVGFAEVENEYVVRRISNVLRYDFGIEYGYVHYDSPDRRGIDVACLYRKESISKIDSRQIEIKDFKTRDILHLTLKINIPQTQGKDTLHLFVCHMPSKYGGATASAPRRKIAVETLMENLPKEAANIIVTGDFNTTPEDPCLGAIGERLRNEGLGLEATNYPIGTHKFKGEWSLIDNFFTLMNGFEVHMGICRAPFLLEKDKEYGGDKPLRTYLGPRYNAGTSDHLPVYLICYPIDNKSQE